MGGVFKCLSECSVIVSIILTILLTLIEYNSIGAGFLFTAGLIGISVVLLSTGDYLQYRKCKPETEEAILSDSDIKKTDIFMFFSVFFGIGAVTFLWPVYTITGIFPPNSSGEIYIFTLPPVNLMPDNIRTSIIAIIISTLPYLFGNYFFDRGGTPSAVRFFMISAIGFVGSVVLLIIADIFTGSVNGFRPAEFLIPISVITGMSTVISYGVIRGRRPLGFSAAVTVIFVFIGFLGVITATNYNLSGKDFSFFVFLGTMVTILSVITSIYIHRKWKTGDRPSVNPIGGSDKVKVNGKLERKEPNSNVSTEDKRLRNDNKTGKNTRKITAVALILTVSLPLTIFTVTASSSKFPVLANIDNMCIIYKADELSRVDPLYIPNFGIGFYTHINNTIDIFAAKNERESVQLVILPIRQTYINLMSVAFGGFRSTDSGAVMDSADFTVYRIDYPEVLRDRVPDILTEFYPMRINDGKGHPIWLTFYIPPDAEAGEYIGTVTLTLGNITGSSPKVYYTRTVDINVRLHVFNFTLPSVPSLKSDFGFRTDRQGYSDVMAEFKRHRMMRWVRIAAPEFNISEDGSVDYINFSRFDFEIAEAYSYNFHSIGILPFRGANIMPGTFTVDGKTYDAANYSICPKFNYTYADYIAKVEEHLKSINYTDDYGRVHTAYEDAYFNGHDEAGDQGEEIMLKTIEDYRWYKYTVNLTLPIMQTMMGWHPELAELCDIICYHIDYGEPDFIRQWKAKGKEVWIYTTGGPRYPVPGISLFGFQLQVRGIAWLCYLKNYTHYLIWDTATEFNGRMGMGYEGWMGGSLLYEKPGGGYRISLRMEAIRDGFEDYEYFVMLDKIGETINKRGIGGEYLTDINKIKGDIVGLVNDYEVTADIRLIDSIRVSAGRLISDFITKYGPITV